MSEFGRFSGVFFEPRAAFQDIAQRPRWVVPLVVLILAGLAFSVALSMRVDWSRVVRQQMEASSRAQEMPADQREMAIATGAKVAAVMAYAGPLIFLPLAMLIVAAAVSVIPKVLYQAQITFKQVFAIVCYASLTGLIRTANVLLIMLVKPTADFDPQQGTIFDLGFYLPSAAPKWLASLGGSLDLFTIWVILLIATGLSAASRKLSWTRGFTAVFAPWLVWVLCKAGWAALFG